MMKKFVKVLLAVLLVFQASSLTSNIKAEDFNEEENLAWAKSFEVVTDKESYKIGDTVTFTVVNNSGTDCTYQWVIIDDIDEEGMVMETPIEGATTDTFSFVVETGKEQFCVNIECEEKGYKTGYWSYYHFDNDLTVEALPDSYNEVNYGDPITLKVETSCTLGEVNITWYDEFSPEVLATGDTYTIDKVEKNLSIMVSVDDEYDNYGGAYFYVAVNNKLTIEDKTVNSINNDDGFLRVIVGKGETATLEVSGTTEHGTLSYQWEKMNYSTDDSTVISNESKVTVPVGTYKVTALDEFDHGQGLVYVVSEDNGLEVTKCTGEYDDHSQAYNVVVKKGETVTLDIEASCNEGDIHYDWTLNSYDPSGDYLTEMVHEKSSVKIESVQGACFVEVYVTDDFGDLKLVVFRVQVENGLKGSLPEITCGNKGDKITLDPKATCSEGELSYAWYRFENKKYTYLGNSSTIEVVLEDGVAYECDIFDKYQNILTVNTKLHEHKVVTLEAKEPTATETGLTEGKKCSVCGEVFVAQKEIPALKNELVADDTTTEVEVDKDTDTIITTVATTEEEPTVTLSENWTWTDETGKEVTTVEVEPGAVVELTAENETEVVTVILKGNVEIIEEGTEEEVTEKSETLSVHCNGKLELLEEVYLDGKLVDPANYDLVEGSTIVVFKKAFLATLTTGEHTVELSYPAGKAEAKINVKTTPVVPEVKPEEKVPETGDKVNLTMLYGMMAVSAIGIGVALVARKKYED